MAALESELAPELSDAIRSPNPFTVVTAAEMAAALDEAEGNEIVVHICDKYWRRIGEAGDRLSLVATKPRNNVPTVEIVFPQDSPWKKYVRKCRTEVVGIEVECGNLRWAAVVDTATYEMKKTRNGAERTITAKAFGIWEVLQYLLIWPNFLLPIQVQIPSHAWFLGPLCSVIEIMISEQAFRIQSGLWELVNNAGSLNPDLRAWFGTWLLANGDIFEMLTTPIYVVHHNPIFDPSPTVSGTFRMETVATAIEELSKAYGVTVDVELWRPGDPKPDQWFPHAGRTSPVYVVRVNDHSGVTGPTHTFLDGILFQLVNLQGAILGDLLDPILNPRNEFAPEGVFIAPTLGLEFMKPWPVLMDHPRGPMESFKIVDHHPSGWQLIIGGKSPKWINDLINATLAWLIDSLMIIIGFTGVPSTLLDGLLNDAFLAFQLIEVFNRRSDMGPYATRIEKFQATGAAPYNIDALFAFISLLWETRGYRSAVCTFRNGLPFWLGRDIFVGSLLSLVDDEGALYTDYVENVALRQTRLERCDVMVQMGDGKREEPPIVRTQRLITGIQEGINVLTLSQ